MTDIHTLKFDLSLMGIESRIYPGGRRNKLVISRPHNVFVVYDGSDTLYRAVGTIYNQKSPPMPVLLGTYLVILDHIIREWEGHRTVIENQNNL